MKVTQLLSQKYYEHIKVPKATEQTFIAGNDQKNVYHFHKHTNFFVGL
jgi:hypothetical protein